MGTCRPAPLDLNPQTFSPPGLQTRLTVGLHRRWQSLFVCAVVALSLAWPTMVSAQATIPAGTFDRRILIDPEGGRLIFADQDELIRFLSSAEERSVKILSRGITGARRLRLEQDGVEARVIFHHVDRKESRVKRLPNGRSVMFLRDSYSSQVAAYRLSSLLGMQNVPPTVERVSGGVRGSAQLWIEQAMTEDIRVSEKIELGDHNLWNQSLADMQIFDNLINNIDRNQGNMLVDSFGNLWLIDHTRSFGQDRVLPFPEMITRCSNRMLAAIRSLDEAVLLKELSPYLSRAEIKALWDRRSRVLKRVEQAIDTLGGEWVLFDYGDPDPGVTILYD